MLVRILAAFIVISSSSPALADQTTDVFNCCTTSVSHEKTRPFAHIIGLTASGQTLLDCAPIKLADLQVTLRTMLLSNPKTRILIRAEFETKFSQMVAVLDLLKDVGIPNASVYIQTQSQKSAV